MTNQRPHVPELLPLMVVGGVVACTGIIAVAALFGLSWLVGLAVLWRQLFGWLALPIAMAVLAAGVGLLARRRDEPWSLPWGRALGGEVTIAATLALLASAFGAPTTDASIVPFAPGPGGLVGWSLAAATSVAVGPVLSTLAWFAVGMVGLLALFRIGAHRIARRLDAVADTLADGTSVPAGGTSVLAGASDDGAAPRASTSRQEAATPSAVDRHAGDAAPRDRPIVRRSDTGASAPRAESRRRSARSRGVGRLPDLSLLTDDPSSCVDDAALQLTASAIERALAGFGVPAQVVEIEQGPTVTRFGVKPGLIESGQGTRRVRVARIAALKRDLALALSASSVRIEAPIPGRPLVGIEVPNPEMNPVGIKGILASKTFRDAGAGHGLAVALGRDVAGAPLVADLTALPHLLIAGATGSGKSVCLDAILVSLLFQGTPDALRLVLIDPKRVELVRFAGLPHLMAGVVTEMEEIVGTLRWVVAEMEDRYKRFEGVGVRDRDGYNARSPAGEPAMPALVVVIDELADMMMVAPEAAEPLLVRVAQLGRATGIHLVVATQRPSVDVVTGLIKANFPARISFAVASGTDSRVVLDRPGAESLLGRGDMLVQAPDAAAPQRAQGAFVSDEEIARVVEFWSSSHWGPTARTAPWDDLVAPIDPDEALYQRAQAIADERQDVTASLLQRRLRVGYGTARNLYNRLVDEGRADERGGSQDGDDRELRWTERDMDTDDEFDGS